MKNKSKTAPLLTSTDPQSLRSQIGKLKELGYKITRPNYHQIKVGGFNWYWETGTITIDPCHKYHAKGFSAFVALIQKSIPITFTMEDDCETLPEPR